MIREKTNLQFTLYRFNNGKATLSVHDSGECNLDFGQELISITRNQAVSILRRARRGEWISCIDYPWMGSAIPEFEE